MVCQNRVFKI